MKSTSLICCCLILSIPALAWPQSQFAAAGNQGQEKRLLEPERSRKIKERVEQRGTGQPVRVTLRNKTEVKGYISQVDADSFQITDKKTGRATTITYSEVEKVRKPGLSVGTKLGIVAAVAAGVGIALVTTLPKD